MEARRLVPPASQTARWASIGDRLAHILLVLARRDPDLFNVAAVKEAIENIEEAVFQREMIDELKRK